MDMRHLRTIVVLAEELHFGRAAKRLHVVQSAVSQTLKDVESRVGVRLFSRTRRSVTLTPAGEAMVDEARLVLARCAAMPDVAKRAEKGVTGRLRLQFALMSALSVVPKAIVRFRSLAPRVELTLEPAPSDAQLDALRGHHIDVGFVTFLPHTDGLSTLQVTRERLVTLVHRRHRLARRRSVRLSDLADENMIMLDQRGESRIAQYYRTACERAGFTPRVSLEVSQLDTLLAFVAAGLGVSHAPASVALLRHPGVAMVPLVPVIPAGITAVWNPDHLSPTAARFLEALRAELRGAS